MEWIYEPAAVECNRNIYIPDFYVTGIGFLEIKPSYQHLEKESFFKLKSAAQIIYRNKRNAKLFSLCSSQPTIGNQNPNKNILEWTNDSIKPIGLYQFVYLLAKASDDLRKRSFQDTIQVLEYFIKASGFIKQEPTPMKYGVTKLIMEFSNNSYSEIPQWELNGVLQRKTLTNIINDLAIDLELERQKLYHFTA